MNRYIEQLLEDIGEITQRRLQENPSYYQGMAGQNQDGEIGFDAGKNIFSDEEMEEEPEKMFAEMEAWMSGEGARPMFEIFDLKSEQFPPEERMTEKQIEKVNTAIIELWFSFNFTAEYPEKLPSRSVYSLLVKEMHNSSIVVSEGMIHIEFCDNDPSQCPFDAEYCSCKAFY